MQANFIFLNPHFKFIQECPIVHYKLLLGINYARFSITSRKYLDKHLSLVDLPMLLPWQGSFAWLQNKEELTLVGVFMEGTTLTC
jgi:hypothetical protein